MKKILAGILILTMAAGLFGCSKSDSNGKETTTDITKESVTDPVDDSFGGFADDIDNGVDNGVDGDNAGSGSMDSTELENKVVAIFEEEIAKGTSIEEIAKLIAPVTEFDCEVRKVEEGYLMEFTEDVKGFKNGYAIVPIVGSIPYVSYIFETDDAEAFAARLKDTANPRWNICTEASEPVIKVKDNYVFLTMCPGADW